MLMTQWSVKYMSLVDLIQIAGRSLSGPQADQLAKAPPILRETLLFPYEDGLSFVQGIYDKGGWAAVEPCTPTRRTRPRRSCTRSCTPGA